MQVLPSHAKVVQTLDTPWGQDPDVTPEVYDRQICMTAD